MWIQHLQNASVECAESSPSLVLGGAAASLYGSNFAAADTVLTRRAAGALEAQCAAVSRSWACETDAQPAGTGAGVGTSTAEAVLRGVTKERAREHSLQQAVASARADSKRQALQALHVLRQAGALLHALVPLKLQPQRDFDRAQSEWLEARAGTMQRKLDVLAADIEADTYTEEAVRALAALAAAIRQALGRATTEAQQLNTRLAHYQAYVFVALRCVHMRTSPDCGVCVCRLGPRFETLLAEYREVLASVRDKQWAAANLGLTR